MPGLPVAAGNRLLMSPFSSNGNTGSFGIHSPQAVGCGASTVPCALGTATCAGMV